MSPRSPSAHAASHGEPSYVWRDGQQRRMEMILQAAGEKINGAFLEVGCGMGLYLERIAPRTEFSNGLEIEWERAQKAARRAGTVTQGVGEQLPFLSNSFDVVLSHEVIEHVTDDRAAVREMIRVLRPGGRLILFCPNRWYPVETHGIYWRGNYIFGNIPFVNYLPQNWRDRLAPHVRAYTRKDLEALFAGLPVNILQRTVIYGGYDNIIARFPRIGRWIRSFLYALESTPLRIFGLSHFWVGEKVADE